MPYSIRYSTRAYIEYEELLDYLFKNFGIATTAKVDRYFEEVIKSISINPLIYPISDTKKELRRCVISKQSTLYYRFDGEYVELASFRGNFMNPETLNL